MMQFTQQVFPSHMIERTPRRSELFDDKGHQFASRCSMEDVLRNYNMLHEADIPSTAAFIVHCLQLDPSERPTAEQLLADPWLKS